MEHKKDIPPTKIKQYREFAQDMYRYDVQDLSYRRLIQEYNRDFVKNGIWVSPPFHHNQDEFEIADYCLKFHNTLVALQGFDLHVAALSILVCNETNKRITIHSEEVSLGKTYTNPVIFHPEKSSSCSYFTYDIDLDAPSLERHLERFSKYLDPSFMGFDCIHFDEEQNEIKNFNVDSCGKEQFKVYIPLRMVTAFATGEMY